MKRFIIFFILFCGLNSINQAQDKDIKKIQPKEDIKVNREFDEQGNLIRFDSTYTYNWSNDSTFVNSILPKDFDRFFDDHFNFFNDSSFIGNSFFEDFDNLFFSPFSNKRDSALIEKFGKTPFHSFQLKSDTVPLNSKEFDEFFGQILPHKSDSIQLKSPGKPFSSTPRNIDEIMKMMQQHMQEMEEMQRKFFDDFQTRQKQQKSL